jgi:hypothetical protein
LQHLQTQRQLNIKELQQLFKLEKYLNKTDLMATVTTTFDKQMEQGEASFNELCYMLAEGKASEIKAVKQLSVVEFKNLCDMFAKKKK